MRKRRSVKSTALTPAQAEELLLKLEQLGFSLAEIAARLKVSPLYATRLAKSGYWPSGKIPLKASAELQHLWEENSPEAHRQRIITMAGAMGKGDCYIIHSLRPVLEFRDPEIRQAILGCAGRGTEIRYIIPDLSNVFTDFGAAGLELADLIPADLVGRYQLLMQTLMREAASSEVCSVAQLQRSVHFEQQRNGFLFSPWNKIIFIDQKSKGQEGTVVYQEHFSLEPNASGLASNLTWSCKGAAAERIGRILLGAKTTPLQWPDL